jgi:hypothetical protein
MNTRSILLIFFCALITPSDTTFKNNSYKINLRERAFNSVCLIHGMNKQDEVIDDEVLNLYYSLPSGKKYLRLCL